MEVVINNKHLLGEDAASFERQVERKLKSFERVLKGYKKKPPLEIHVKKVNAAGEYRISASLNMKRKPLFIEDSGIEPAALIASLLDRLKRWTRQQVHIERKEYLHERKTRHRETIGEHLVQLQKQIEKKDRKAFAELLQKNLPGVKNYISRRLKMAQLTSLLKTRQLTLEDLTDELYLQVFEKFDQRPKDKVVFLPWVFKLADEIIEKHLKETEFEKEHTASHIEKLVKDEYKTLEENFSANAEGQPVMLEEMDEQTYQGDYYHWEDIFTEDSEEELLEQIDRHDIEDAHEVISLLLARLPALERSVFDLYILESKTIEEIAYIKGRPEKEIGEIIEKVRKILRGSLKEASLSEAGEAGKSKNFFNPIK